MDDRNLMENMLLVEKGLCDLFMHGTIESSSQNVHQTFSDSLNTALSIQEQIYCKMQQKGWYSADQADRNKMSSVKMKFGAQA